MYYNYIILSVLMFGGCFLIKDIYRKKRNTTDIIMTFESMFIGSLAGLFVLFIINGFKFEFTFFTFIMVLLTTLNNLAFTYCSFKALKSINLSVFSLFTMLGGMLLPFFQGILFYNEGITLGKILCVILIGFSLLLTIKKGEKKSGYIYYLGIFILNGLSGVLANLFSEATFEKTSAAGYSILLAIVSIIVSFIALVIIYLSKKEQLTKPNLSSTTLCITNGILDKVANYLLVFALLYVDASIQYPMVTGGVMIVSTISSFLMGIKPSKKEVVAVLIAFIAMLVLFFVPI